jgi:3-phenylpropionate/trans-cinnamate dioxygenase ferredoxin subunit
MRVPLGRADLPPGGLRAVAAAGGRLILLARVGDRFFALDDTCNHSGCLLSGGRLVGALVRCPCHGMEFDVRTGALASVPQLCEDQRSYPVAVEDGEAFAEVPE